MHGAGGAGGGAGGGGYNGKKDPLEVRKKNTKKQLLPKSASLNSISDLNSNSNSPATFKRF